MIFTDKTLPSVFLDHQRFVLDKVKSPRYEGQTVFKNSDFEEDKRKNRAKYVVFDTPYFFKDKSYNIKTVVYYSSYAANYYYKKKSPEGKSLGRRYIFDLSQRILDRVPVMFNYVQINDLVTIENNLGNDNVVLIPQQPTFTIDGAPYYELTLSDFTWGGGSGVYPLKNISVGNGYRPSQTRLEELRFVETWDRLPSAFKNRYEESLNGESSNTYNRGYELYVSAVIEAAKFTSWKSYFFLASRQSSPRNIAETIGISIPDAGFQSFNKNGRYDPYDNLYKTLWTKAFEEIYDNEVNFGSDPNLFQGTLGSDSKIRPDIEAVVNGNQPSTIVRNKTGLMNKNGAISAISKDEQPVAGGTLDNILDRFDPKYKDEGPGGILVRDITDVLSDATVTFGNISDAIDQIPNFPSVVGNPNVTSPVDDITPEDTEDGQDPVLDQTPKSPFKEGTASVVPPDSATSVTKGVLEFRGENKEGDSTWGVMTSPGSHFILDEKGNAKIKAAPPVDTDLTMGNVEIGSEHGTRINVGTSLKIDVNQSGKHKEETTMSSSGSQSKTKIYYPAFSINVTNGGLDVTCENGNISFLGKNIIMNATENLHLNGTRSLGLFSSFTGSKGGAFNVAKQIGSLFGFELPVGGGGEILIKGGKLNMDVTSLKDSASQRQSKTGAAKTSEVGSSNAIEAIDSAADINLSTSGNVRISAGQKVRIEAQNFPINTSNPLTIPPVWWVQQPAAFEVSANVLAPPTPVGISFASSNSSIRATTTGLGGITLGTQVGSINLYTGKVIPAAVSEAVPQNILLSSALGTITQRAGAGIITSTGISVKSFTPAGALDIIAGFKKSSVAGIKFQDIQGVKFDTTLGFDKTSKLGSAFEFDAGAFSKLDGATWAKLGFGAATQKAPAININTEGAYNVNSGGTVSINSGGALNVSTTGAIGLLAGGAAVLSGALNTTVVSAATVLLIGPIIKANGEDLTVDNIGLI